ncbi:MAG: 16S rRNA (cytosine(1402)-N(4))-methyltransferase RsmH [Bdellovibrionales bacterium]
MSFVGGFEITQDISQKISKTGYQHTPVLVSEMLSLFPENFSPKNLLDCTFGRGGHALELLKKYPDLNLVALDRDQEAIDHGQNLNLGEKARFLKMNFHDFSKNYLEKKEFDIILMDLGVSSPQLESPQRGFSFNNEGPLDMRMDQSQKLTAADIVNSFSKKELEDLFSSYGEIKRPFAVVDSIFQQRKKKKFETTKELVDIIQKHHSRGFSGRHPATLYFLALRLFVNQELEGLKESLPSFLPFLGSGAYFIVISFHSLEDRIVKRTFKDFVSDEKGSLIFKKVIRASQEERQSNPRSRSAKMRVFCKR